MKFLIGRIHLIATMSRLIFQRGSVLLNEVQCVVSGRFYSKELKNVDQRLKPEKIKKPDEPVDAKHILVLNNHRQTVGRMTLVEAELMAKRRNGKLIKLDDPTLGKSKMESYQLLLKEQTVAERAAVESKEMTINAKISEHDFAIKLKNVQKWISKGVIAKISVNHLDSPTSADHIVSAFEKIAAEVNFKVAQKQTSGTHTLKFSVQPDKKKASISQPSKPQTPPDINEESKEKDIS